MMGTPKPHISKPPSPLHVRSHKDTVLLCLLTDWSVLCKCPLSACHTLDSLNQKKRISEKMAAYISCLLCIDLENIYIIYIYFLFHRVNSALNYSVVSDGQATYCKYS